ncbi:hypothetical protein BHE74_00035783 [Ensete ventricosum]|nr:hypothetical protein GW17_00053151 [Ensete ventricosum]RWW57442.1 hypothetical protein BHE74_00035783 [Ensete ventricosum]RZS11892.1 hypothetical protein BHM03_00043267 [Ensete ventricosum]
MQDLFGSVRRSLVFRPNINGNDGGGGNGGGGIAEKIGSCLRKSRIGLGLGFGASAPKLPPPPPSPLPVETDDALPIRWRKGELIGCGAFGHVYMGMNLDSGELLAVKQGANILVDNKGCIKLADFGASKQVAKLVRQETRYCFYDAFYEKSHC